jgi:CubicO group peptidase (beta-lactamase class C family)
MTLNHLPGGAEIADLMPASDMFNETGYRGVGFGLGLAVMQNLAHAALPGSIGEVTWGGLAGTFFFIDPKDDMFAIFMVQTPSQRGRIQLALKTLIYQALGR